MTVIKQEVCAHQSLETGGVARPVWTHQEERGLVRRQREQGENRGTCENHYYNFPEEGRISRFSTGQLE